MLAVCVTNENTEEKKKEMKKEKKQKGVAVVTEFWSRLYTIRTIQSHSLKDKKQAKGEKKKEEERKGLKEVESFEHHSNH